MIKRTLVAIVTMMIFISNGACAIHIGDYKSMCLEKKTDAATEIFCFVVMHTAINGVVTGYSHSGSSHFYCDSLIKRDSDKTIVSRFNDFLRSKAGDAVVRFVGGTESLSSVVLLFLPYTYPLKDCSSS